VYDIDPKTTTVEQAIEIWNQNVSVAKTKYTSFRAGSQFNNPNNPDFQVGNMTLEEFHTPDPKYGTHPKNPKIYLSPKDVFMMKVEKTKGSQSLKTTMGKLRLTMTEVVAPSLSADNPLLKFIPKEGAKKNDPSVLKYYNVLSSGGIEPAKGVSRISVTTDPERLASFFNQLDEIRIKNPSLEPIANAIEFHSNIGSRPGAIYFTTKNSGLRLSEWSDSTRYITIDPEGVEGADELFDEFKSNEDLDVDEDTKTKSKRTGVGKEGFRGQALGMDVPVNRPATVAIRSQLAFNLNNPNYNKKGTNNPLIFVKYDGTPVSSDDVNRMLRMIRVPDFLAFKKYGLYFDTLYPSKEDIKEAALAAGYSESQAEEIKGKIGSQTIRNMHGSSAVIRLKLGSTDIDYLHGRVPKGDVSQTEAQGYAGRHGKDVIPEDFDHAEKMGEWYNGHENRARSVVNDNQLRTVYNVNALSLQKEQEWDAVQADADEVKKSPPTATGKPKTVDEATATQMQKLDKDVEYEVSLEEKRKAELQRIEKIPEENRTEIEKRKLKKLHSFLKIKTEPTAEEVKAESTKKANDQFLLPRGGGDLEGSGGWRKGVLKIAKKTPIVGRVIAPLYFISEAKAEATFQKRTDITEEDRRKSKERQTQDLLMAGEEGFSPLWATTGDIQEAQVGREKAEILKSLPLYEQIQQDIGTVTEEKVDRSGPPISERRARVEARKAKTRRLNELAAQKSAIETGVERQLAPRQSTLGIEHAAQLEKEDLGKQQLGFAQQR
jgi:hypothetical protein